MLHDPETGLVYTEKIVHQRTRAQIALEDSVYSRTVRPRPGRGVSSQGTNPLRQTATLCLLRNLDLLDTNSLTSVPRTILEQIWTAIRQSNLDGNHLWKIFAPTGCLGLSSVRTYQIQPEDDFKRSIDLATSHSFAWITELTLQDASLTADDFLHISNLRNLKSIQVVVSKTEYAVFHDRIIRSWAEAAIAEGCFSKLESIFVLGHPYVSTWSLQYINCFPFLDTFTLHYCGVKDASKARANAEKVGWLLDRQSRCVEFASEVSHELGRPIHGLYRDWKDLVEAYFTRRRLTEDNQANTPLLKLALKGSRKALPPLALPNQFKDDCNNLFCFERDWQSQATNQAPQPEEEQRAKKRKLRDGKALPLNSVLNGL